MTSLRLTFPILLAALALPLHAQTQIAFPAYSDTSGTTSTQDCRLNGIDQFCLISSNPNDIGPYGPIYVDADSATGPTGLPLSFADVQPAIEAALTAWNEVAHSGVTFSLPVLPHNGEQNVSLIRFNEGTGNGVAVTVGQALVYTDSVGRYDRFQITLDPNARWSVTPGYVEGDLYSTNGEVSTCPMIGAVDLQSVMAHESGHTLRLAHLAQDNPLADSLTMDGSALSPCSGPDRWWTRTFQRTLEAGDELGATYTTPDLGRLATAQTYPHTFVAYAPDVTVTRSYTMSAGQRLTAEADIHLADTGAIDAQTGSTLDFLTGVGLHVEGDLTADGATLTEAEAGQGWDGIAVYEGGSLELDGATVSKADIGVRVASLNVVISDSKIEDNVIGIESGQRADYCPPGSGNCGIYGRSAFILQEDTEVSGSTVVTGNPKSGVGVFARFTDAEITDTRIEENESAGLFLWNADINPFFRSKVLENGNTGAFIFNNGDLRLQAGDTGPGRDCFTDNTDDELWVDFDGFLLVGNGQDGGENSIFDNDDLGPDTYLIFNEVSGTTIQPIDAYDTWWGTGGPPPNGAFNVGVVATDPLPNDLTNCVTQSRQASSVRFDRGTVGVEDEAQEDDQAWLRDEIRALRTDLEQALVTGEGAHEALRALYSAQRFDRADDLGEHAETMALIGSVRALLVGGEVLSAELRDAAEAALIAEVADALRHGDADGADALVRTHEALVTGERAGRSLALHAAMVDEAAGRTVEALARVEGVQAALDPESQETEGVAFVAAALTEQMSEGEARPAGALAARRPEATSRSAASPEAFRLLAPYPNPSSGSITVPVILGTAGNVHVTVFDVLGRKVVHLADGRLEAGRHRLSLDGAQLPAGVYLVRATFDGPSSSGQAHTARLTLVK